MANEVAKSLTRGRRSIGRMPSILLIDDTGEAFDVTSCTSENRKAS